jgi:membrane-associated protein
MEILNYVLHLNENITNLVNLFGPFTYIIVFLVIFAETGLVVTPFLPGDSLLFALGTIAGGGFLNIWIVYFTLLIAAILGDNTNYWIGYKIGPKVFSKENSRIFNKAYLEKTRIFYAKRGVKTIILARFFPFIRTFAPFVAGVGKMHYLTFFSYSIVGNLLWVTLFTFAGYFFGGLPIIKKNFEFAIMGVILFSLIPLVFEYIKDKRETVSEKIDKTSYKDIQATFKKEHLND